MGDDGDGNYDIIDWDTLEEKNERLLKDLERAEDVRYNGYGNDRFVVVGGSEIRVVPELHGYLDREIETENRIGNVSRELPHPSRLRKGDIVVNRELWELLDQEPKEFIECARALEDRELYYLNFRKANSDLHEDDYAGFLRVEEGIGYDVIVETDNPSQRLEGEEFLIHPMPYT